MDIEISDTKHILMFIKFSLFVMTTQTVPTEQSVSLYSMFPENQAMTAF